MMESVAAILPTAVMNEMTVSQLPLALPEMVMLAMVSIILIVDLFLSQKTRGTTYILTQATLIGLIALTIATFAQKPTIAFNGTFVRDGMGDLLKIFIYIITFAVFLYSKNYLKSRDI